MKSPHLLIKEPKEYQKVFITSTNVLVVKCKKLYIQPWTALQQLQLRIGTLRDFNMLTIVFHQIK